MQCSKRYQSIQEGTILVTGAAGFIGSHTCEQLIAAGHRVIGVDNLRTGRYENLWNVISNERFIFVEGDVLKARLMNKLCREYQPDALIHLAGLVSVVEAQRNPDKNFQLNLQATQIVASAAKRQKVRRIVFASSAAVYGDCSDRMIHENCQAHPIGLYGGAKLASEQLLLAHSVSYDMEVICLRYFNVYGDRQDPTNPYSGVISIFSDRFARGLPVTVFGDGEQTRDFISVRDVARANVLAATNECVESGSRNICSGKSCSINELLAIFRAIYPNAPQPIYQPARAGEIFHSCGNGGYASMVLGFEPFVSMEDGICDLIATQRLEQSRVREVTAAAF